MVSRHPFTLLPLLLVATTGACASDVESTPQPVVIDVAAVGLDMVHPFGITGQCLSEPVDMIDDQMPDCTIYISDVDPACSCEGPWRAPATESARLDRAREALDDEALGIDGCLCELPYLEGDALGVCQSGAEEGVADGWCYLDATRTPAVGSPDGIANCPADAKRMLRFGTQGIPNALGPAAVVMMCMRSDPKSGG